MMVTVLLLEMSVFKATQILLATYENLEFNSNMIGAIITIFVLTGSFRSPGLSGLCRPYS